jgi:glycine hydroxymethyltransferase
MSDFKTEFVHSTRYVERIESLIGDWNSPRIANHIERLAAAHDAWRERCLNMNPAESLLSRRCRRLLASDMATRLTEGLPGAKLYPHGRQNEFIDEIEAIIITLARQLFHARFVEWRPVSTTMANAAAFFALLRPGDVVLSQDEDGGGNYVYNKTGALGLANVRIANIPVRGIAFELDLERLADEAQRLQPRLIAVGGSNVLFPYPVRQLREIADRTGAILVYDAAHVGLLISAGDFQRPLDEGAHVVTLSTHKIMGGPVGGLVLTNDPDIAERVAQVTFPGLMQTRDQNKYAALALALAETREFGVQLAAQMVANARCLAQALHEQGFPVLAQDRGYTRTHQLFLQLGTSAKSFETACQAVNILVSDCALTGDMARSQRTGARLATHEITRLGMKEAETRTIASLIGQAVRRTQPAESIAAAVADLLARHQRVEYSFD